MSEDLIKLVKELRINLDPVDGQYSICRSDGKPLLLPDIFSLGTLMERIDYDKEKIRDPVVEMTGVDTELKEDIKAYQLAISILEKEAGK